MSPLALRILALAVLVSPVVISRAAVTEAEAQRLGRELTPVGAERAANKDGSIPEWQGGVTQPPTEWKTGQPRIDLFKDDRKLLSIDATNVDRHSARLAEGQVALLKSLPGYRMDIYPTRRSCGYDARFYERTRTNATTAKLAADGWQLQTAIGHAVPFPIPANGTEAMWNHKLRFNGEGRIEYFAAILPGKDGSFVPKVQKQLLATPFHGAQAAGTEGDGVELLILNEVLSPAANAGELILFHNFMNRASDAWLYFPGQRRVRRAPTFAYDNPVPGYDNLETVDQYYMFLGNLDRYDWKLVGKQELYVPYNNAQLVSKQRKYTEIYQARFPNRDLMRYELHRVWKIEATVKPGMRHQFPKRTVYLDEDSWTILHHDMYDAQGKLWRVQEGSLHVAYELPACVNQEFTAWDLPSGRYIADNATQEQPETDWLAAKEGRLKPSQFSPDELRRIGSR